MQASDMVQHDELWWRRDIVRLGVKREGTRTILFVPVQSPDYTSYPSFLLSWTFCTPTKTRMVFLSDVLKRQLPWGELASHFCQCEGRGGCIELEKNALEVASLLASLLAHYLLKRRFTEYHRSIPYLDSTTTSVFVFCLSAINIHRAGLPQIAITMKVSHWNLLVDNTSVATPLWL